MNPLKPVGVVGGDLRQAQIARILHSQGYHVKCFYLEECLQIPKSWKSSDAELLKECHVVLLPAPLSFDDVFIAAPYSAEKVSPDELFSHIAKDAQVFGGKIPSWGFQKAAEAGFSLTDYLTREELAIANAALTAEAAIALAIGETAFSLMDAKVLVTGHGRIAKALLQRLRPFGCTLFCAARKKSDLAQIRTDGFYPVPMESLPEMLPKQNIVLNTVPALIFPRQVLEHASKDCLFIDLASMPGGIDFAAAEALDIGCIRALSLPGKTAPLSAANLILQTVSQCLKERMVSHGQ